MQKIPLSVPNLNTDILGNIRECIETGWVSTGGRFIGEFEEKIAAYTGAAGAVSTQSGTAGLHLALQVTGVGLGDEVIVPALTFIAAVNPVRYIGAEPVFMDCDDSLCIDPDKLERFCGTCCDMTDGGLVNRATGKRVAAVIVVHVFGNMADMGRIIDVANRYGLAVIEDATEALGTCYSDGEQKGRFSGTLGDIGVYSFNANKIITTGGGGMIVSDDKGYLERARYLSLTAKDDPLFFVHDEVGYNYRMLNIQAAFGVSQIDELESFIAAKKKNYELYGELLAGAEGLTLLPFSEGTRPNYWFYSLRVDERFPLDRNGLMRRLLAAGVECRPVWRLACEQKPYRNAFRYEVEKACEYAENTLNLPCSAGLRGEQVEYVCEVIRAK